MISGERLATVHEREGMLQQHHMTYEPRSRTAGLTTRPLRKALKNPKLSQ